MRPLYKLLTTVCLTACGPAKPDGAGEDPTTGAESTTGDESTTSDDAPTSTTSTTTEHPTSTSTSTATTDTTGAPVETPPASIYILEYLPYTEGEQHGFTGLEIWAPDPALACPIDPPACDGNAAPEFGAPAMFLNGAWVDITAPVHAGDRVGIAYPYFDLGCNLGCGWYASSVETPDQAGDSGGSLDVLPCASDPALGFEFSEVDLPGLYRYSLRATDACGAVGELVGSFEVLP